MKTHLDRELYDLLLAGKLNEVQEEQLLSHLREDCDECEDFLARLDDQELWALMNTVEKATDPDPLLPEKMREIPSASWGFFRRTPALLPALGFASLAIIALGIVFVHHSLWDEEETSRTKGQGILFQSSSVELSVGKVESGDSSSVRIARIGKGGRITENHRLTFRMDTDGPCYLYLASISDGSMDILYPVPGSASAYHKGGTLIPEIDGCPASMSLKGYKGRLRFVAVCTSQALLKPQEDLKWLEESDELSTRVHKGVESLDIVDLLVSSEEGKP